MALPQMTLTLADGTDYCLTDYTGTILLIVNTATGCGLAPQFHELEQLYRQYKDQNFLVLGFPCNQFANQEPVENRDMIETCQLKYDVTFPLHERLDVNGDQAHPLYQWLRTEQQGLFGSQIK